MLSTIFLEGIMKVWSDEEVKALFSEVENLKKNGYPLVDAFLNHGKKFLRKPNSVRNYYYHEVDNLLSDRSRCKKLEIDIEKHTKKHFKNFDKEQEGELFDQIDALVRNGLSVRGACLKLSNGDLTTMTRFQNKYQNMKRKLVQNITKDGRKNISNLKNSQMGEVIPFKANAKGLTDNDINSLFLGLVKLIKKSAQEEAQNTPSDLLKRAFENLNEKNNEITRLKLEFERLKRENGRLMQKVEGKQSKKKVLENHLAKNRVSQEREQQKRV